MKIIPKAGKVLIKTEKEEYSLLTPQQVNKRTKWGEIIRLGRPREEQTIEVKEGDRVFYSTQGIKFIDNKEYGIVEHDNILIKCK